MYRDDYLNWCRENLEGLFPILEQKGYKATLDPEEDGNVDGSLRKEEDGGFVPVHFSFEYADEPKLLLFHHAKTEGNKNFLKEEDWKELCRLTPFGLCLFYYRTEICLKGEINFYLRHVKKKEAVFPKEEVLSALVDAQEFLRSLVPYFQKENPRRDLHPYLERIRSGKRRKFLRLP